MCRHVHSYMYVTSGSEIVKDAAHVISHGSGAPTGGNDAAKACHGCGIGADAINAYGDGALHGDGTKQPHFSP